MRGVLDACFACGVRAVHAAPVVQAYALMWELKELFDPDYVLNPGVILNRDPDVHIKALKPSPAASAIVNRCIECGFCESNCPSKDVTLTPRQRITVFREMHRLNTLSEPSQAEKSRRVYGARARV